MERDRPHAITTMIVVALFVFLLMNLFWMLWVLLDLSPDLYSRLPPRSDTSRSALDLGDKSRFRNFWEIVYFVANSVFAVTGLFAILVARGQLIAAENVRLATVYMDVSKRWMTDDVLLTSRRTIGSLIDFYLANRNRPDFQPFPDMGAYFRAVLEHCMASDRLKLRDYLGIVNFFEDVGLLCRKHYVRREDLFDLLGASVVYYMTPMLPFILALKQDSPAGGGIYANALWLFRHARQRKVFEDDGTDL